MTDPTDPREPAPPPDELSEPVPTPDELSEPVPSPDGGSDPFAAAPVPDAPAGHESSVPVSDHPLVPALAPRSPDPLAPADDQTRLNLEPEQPAEEHADRPAEESEPGPTPDPEPEPEPMLPPAPEARRQPAELNTPLATDAAESPAEFLAPTQTFGLAVLALAFLTVLLLLLTGWLTYAVVNSGGPAPIEDTRKSALEAGRDAARLVFSYDYRHLDKDFAAAEATTTGTFKKEYANTTKKLVGDVAPRYKAVLLAEVSEAGIVNATQDRVLLLVFLDVQSTSTLAAAPKVTPRRLKMTMQRRGDRWLVAAVDAF